MKYQQEYKQLVTDDFNASKADAARMRDAIERSSAHYHGNTVHTLYMPKMYTEDDFSLF